MNDKNDIRVFAMSNYIRPKLVENKTKDWVLNGRNNSFYQYIIDRNNGSVTNNAINKSYSTMILGRGLATTHSNNSQKLNDWVRFRQILSSNDLRRIIDDFQVFTESSFQIVKKRNGDIHSINHIPKEKVVPQIANEKGEIEGYWYCNDWARTSQNIPEYFPAFGTGGKTQTEIYVIKPYSAGKEYFTDPDYLPALQYALMEEEMANYHVSHIQNGLSFGYIINIPNGASYTTEQKDELEKKIKQKLTGSTNAGKFILSFNGVDAEITVTSIDGNSAHKQWEFLLKESKLQICTGHRLTSTSLVGINNSSGFSSTADELEVAEGQLMKNVIAPKQNYIINALEDILNAYGISLDLKFLPLTEEKSTIVETEMSSDCSCKKKSELDLILNKYALDAPEGYELASEEDIKEFNLSANQTSEQDTKRWKIRYAYTIGTSKTPAGKSREFCNKMMALSAKGKVFRKEDIELMSMQGVNGQFAHEGGKYDIFLYGGGVNCYHRWERRIFKKKLNEEGKPYGGGALQQTTEVNVNEAKRQGAKIPKNSPDVAIAEITKPNKGRYPS